MSRLNAPKFTQDAYAPVTYNFTYDQFGTGKFINFPIKDMFQSMSLHQNEEDPSWTGTLTLFDYNDADINKSFILGPQRPDFNSRFNLQWYWSNQINNASSAPIYKVKVLAIHPAFSPTGAGLTMDLLVDGGDASALNKAGKTNGVQIPVSFEAGQDYSTLVRAICNALTAAGYRGWKISFIEPTVGKLPHALHIGGESYDDFIKQKILPLAIQSGNEHFQFRRDNSSGIHFHSPSYLIRAGLASNARNLAKQYVAYADMVGEVESFTPTVAGFWQAIMGGGDATFTSPDSMGGGEVVQHAEVEVGVIPPPPTGKTVNSPGYSPGQYGTPQTTADAQYTTNLRPQNSGGATYTGVVFNPDGSASIVNPGGGASSNPTPAAHVGLIARTPEEANQLATAMWSRLQAATETAEMVVHGTHAVGIDDWISVKYYTHGNVQSYLSGVFCVIGVTNDLGGSGWKTTFSLSRRGVSTDGAASVLKLTPKHSGFVVPSIFSGLNQ